MTGRLLDVSVLPFGRTYVCKNGATINLRKFLDTHYDAILALAAAGLIETNKSFGFAMMAPVREDEEIPLDGEFWDKPEKFVWFVGGWGPDRERCSQASSVVAFSNAWR